MGHTVKILHYHVNNSKQLLIAPSGVINVHWDDITSDTFMKYKSIQANQELAGNIYAKLSQFDPSIRLMEEQSGPEGFRQFTVANGTKVMTIRWDPHDAANKEEIEITFDDSF